MQALKIPGWSGICTITGKQILGLGNDIYQIGVAIIEGVNKKAGKVIFNEADSNRKKNYNIDGIIDLFPSLKDGVLLNEGEITDITEPESLIFRHWQMADYDSSVLRNCLIKYFKPYIQDYLNNCNAYEDTLVIHLRGGDALDKWPQDAWRPSPLEYSFYKHVIEKSGLTKILIVTTPPQNGIMHPAIKTIQINYDADVQHGEILEDLSILINCTNLVLDFSTFGYTAALMNTNLKKVFTSKFVEKEKGISLLKDINSDVGFTMPKIYNCEVYVYDYPKFIIK